MSTNAIVYGAFGPGQLLKEIASLLNVSATLPDAIFSRKKEEMKEKWKPTL